MDIRILYCIGSLLLVTNHAIASEIKRWVDRDGKVHFGDNAPHTTDAVQVEPEIITTAPSSNNSLKDIMRPGERRMIRNFEKRGERLIKAKRKELKQSKLSKKSAASAKKRCAYYRNRKNYLRRRLREGVSRSKKNTIERSLDNNDLKIEEYCR